MPDELAPKTEETLDDFLDRVSGTLEKTVDALREIVPHLNQFGADVLELKLLQAAEEIPAAIEAVGDEATDAAKEAVGAGGEAVATVPAAASDVLTDLESVGDTAEHGVSAGKSALLRRKLRRR